MEKDPSVKTGILFSSIGAVVAGLCCFSPVVIVLFGLGSVGFASSLADTLYGDYKWYFRLGGFALMAVAFAYWYWNRSRGCSLDEKARLRKKMLNIFLVSSVSFVLIYIVWLYVIVELLGVQLGIWELPELSF